jgi:cystathionine beta-lyase family protein involved in aluminum resistance
LVNYKQLDLKDGGIDYNGIESVMDKSVKVVFIQRSKGYTADRKTLSCEEIGKAVEIIKAINKNAVVIVDNCYGEFVEEFEPTKFGADLIVGSLIKNPGGGCAKTGGYIAGKKDLIELVSYRLTSPGIGRECGASLGQNLDMYKGFYLAPHVVAQSLKTSVFCAAVYSELGLSVSPKPFEKRNDIILAITFNDEEMLKCFCQGIQKGSAIDSFVVPQPWDMPGYQNQVIMAAGTFVQGASIELSADGPIREPYIAYVQGGLTFEGGKLGIMMSLQNLIDNKLITL